jgi:succinate--hydroxymethylglutarate CoA-transferase
MCKALDVDGYDDPRVATIAERIKHREVGSALVDLCYAHAANMTMAEATKRFEAQRVPFAMILSPEELTNDEHAMAVGLFETFDHHVVGKARLPRHPAQFHATPAKVELGSPALGEHTDEVLQELGMGDRIDDLRARGVIS